MPMPNQSYSLAASGHADPMNSVRPFPASPRPGSSAGRPGDRSAPQAVAIHRGPDRADLANGSGAALALGLAGYVLALPVAAFALTAVTAVMML